MRDSIIRIFKFVIIIAVIIFVAFFLIKHANVMFKEKVDNDVKTDLLLVQAKIKLIKGKAEVSTNNEAYVGNKVSESDKQDVKDFLKSIKINEEDFEKYYILSVKDLESMGLASEMKNVEDNVFIINYEESDVIYVKGIQIDNTVNYRLSEILAKDKKNWILYNRIEVNE